MQHKPRSQIALTIVYVIASNFAAFPLDFPDAADLHIRHAVGRRRNRTARAAGGFFSIAGGRGGPVKLTAKRSKTQQYVLNRSENRGRLGNSRNAGSALLRLAKGWRGNNEDGSLQFCVAVRPDQQSDSAVLSRTGSAASRTSRVFATQSWKHRRNHHGLERRRNRWRHRYGDGY